MRGWGADALWDGRRAGYCRTGRCFSMTDRQWWEGCGGRAALGRTLGAVNAFQDALSPGSMPCPRA